MTTPTRLSASIATAAVTWPPSGHERMTGEAAATTLLRAGMGGVLGHPSPGEWERIPPTGRLLETVVDEAGNQQTAYLS